MASVRCSYQSFAALDDTITPGQTGNFVETIRFKRRDALFKTRLEKREERLKSLRESMDVAELLAQVESNDSYQSQPDNYSIGLFTGSWGSYDDESFLGPHAIKPSPSDSPAAYSPCSTPTTVCADELDGPILDGISDQMIKKAQQIKELKPRRINVKSRHLSMKTKRSMELLDQKGVERDYLILKKLTQEASKNLNSLKCCLNTHWRLMLRSFFSEREQIRTDTLHLLSSAISKNLIEPASMLNLLSHGLMHSISQILRDNNGSQRVTNFMLYVHQSLPVVFPYLIDMACCAKFFREFPKAAHLGNCDLDSLADFYLTIIPTLKSKIINNQSEKILIPGATSSSQHISEVTMNYYGPMSTSIKMITPELIRSLVEVLNHHYLEPSVLSKVVVVLYEIVQITNLQIMQGTSNLYLVFPLIRALEEANLDDEVISLLNFYQDQTYTYDDTESVHKAILLLTQFLEYYGRYLVLFQSYRYHYRRHVGMR